MTKMTTKRSTVANESLVFPKAPLVGPTASGYVHLAAEVDGKPPFLPNSRKKRELIADLKRRSRRLEDDPSVVSAVVFDAFLIPLGRGAFVKRRPGQVHVARFDLAVLIETTSPEAADALKASPVYREMEHAVWEAASFVHAVAATNVRRMGVAAPTIPRCRLRLGNSDVPFDEVKLHRERRRATKPLEFQRAGRGIVA